MSTLLKSCLCALALCGGASIVLGQVPPAATWIGPEGGGAWDSDANWDTGVHPNAEGAEAVFNDVSQVASRTFTLPVGARAVGAITVNNNLHLDTFFTAGTFRFNAPDAGPARITAQGVGAGRATITSSMIFVDDVVFDVQNRAGDPSVGALIVEGNIVAGSSVGALIKEGPGTMTLAVAGGSTKAYSGPTIVNEGRLRHSLAGIPSASSSVTVEAGAQLQLTGGGNHVYGATPQTVLTLNGLGRPAYAEVPGTPTIPALPASPGAILVQANSSAPTQPTIANLIHLASDSSVSIRNASTLTLTNTVSGPGGLILAAGGDDLDNGTLVLTGSNSYSGGTTVQAGVLEISGAAATVGAGGLVVALGPGLSAAKAQAVIRSGVDDAILDGATLTLAGGGVPNTADQSYLTLEAGVNEVVGGLILGGVAQTMPGSYGSSTSPATFKLDEYFFGDGVVTLAPASDADFDDDNDVDGVDFLTWQRHFGATSGATMGDANGDGLVNGEDFTAWKSSFGSNPAAAAYAAIPEPSSLALLTTLAVAIFRRPAVNRN